MRCRAPLVIAVVAGLTAVTGCWGGDDAVPAAANDPLDLGPVCPPTLVIQTDFNPETTYGWTYNLLGSEYTVDDKRKLVRGPLMAGDRNTGVNVEIRGGGPPVDFTDPGKLMYDDRSITFAYVATDSQIAQYAEYPTISVVAPQSVSSQILMWHQGQKPPYIHTAAGDLGDSGMTIHTFEGSTYAQWLVATGLIRREQWKQDYDGSTKGWEANGGAIVQQGFVDAEPYQYEKQFGKKISYELLFDMGYKIYTQTLAIRTGDRAELAPCLRKLVPIVQRSQVLFQNDPTRANTLIIKLAARWKADTEWDYPADVAAYSVKAQRDNGLVTVDPAGRVGLFDMRRVGLAKQIVELAFSSSSPRVPFKAGITPSDLATNDFIDPTIVLRPGG